MRRPVVLCVVFGLACSVAAQAADDNYPTKPVTLTVNYGAGGGSDAIGRALARALEKSFKQPVAVENIAGGAGTRGVTAVVTSAPDGYKIGVATNSPMTIAVHSVKGLPWGAPSTYDIIGGIGIVYNAICIQPDSTLKNLEEVVSYAKANPGKLKVASIAGGINQYTWDAFAKKAGINIRFVPYSGDADGVASFLGKNTELVNLTWPGLKAQVEAGKARPLAIFAPERMSSNPGVPTFKELGYDVTTTSDYIVYAPKGIPAVTRNRIVDAVKTAVADPDFGKVLAAQNIIVKFTDGAKMTEQFTDVFNNTAQSAQAKP
ncbi:tripartite-type tricarboxylate transporter receptor subunit TctC [Pseudorhodoplanes sinuspersici]|nr:tripartite-type tricarboxylate transporter receptor subunit TctC [Pseudorhodoplanes sinuspersici]